MEELRMKRIELPGAILSLEPDERSELPDNPATKPSQLYQTTQELVDRTRVYNHFDLSEHSLYSGLRDSDEIRLLYLQPGPSGDKINCLVKHTNFFRSPQYEALSYVWGPEDIGNTIILNGVDFKVRENLWTALQYLRSESEIRVLWIDALCINQRNIHERNHQVAQMAEIYNRAIRVVVWLGLPDATSKLALDSLPLHPSPPSDFAKELEWKAKLNAICSLLTREYWTRLWIIQEFLMAKDIIIQCGNDKCSEFRFAFFIEVLDKTIPTYIEDRAAAAMRTVKSSVPARLWRLKTSETRNYGTHILNRPQSNFTARPLYELFLEYQTAKCEDKRDNIFGLHSLARNCCKGATAVDYSLTWRQLYGKMLSHQVLHHSSIPSDVVEGSRDLFVARLQSCYRSAVRSGFSYVPDLGASPNDVAHDPDKGDLCWEDLRWEDLVLHPETTIMNLGLEIIRGYVRGRICYISPPMSTDFNQNHLPLPPELTSRIRLQMDFICSLRTHGQNQHSHITSEFDLVEGNRSRTGGTVTVYNEHKLLSPGIYDAQNTAASSKFIETVTRDEKNFHEVLSIAQKACASKAKYRLAFEESGLIFFVIPGLQVIGGIHFMSQKRIELQVGDVLCQFIRSDVLAVLGKEGPRGYTPIWRGVNILASPSNMVADICGKAMPKSFTSSDTYAVDFEANAEVLHHLCRMSETPNGEHNLLIPEHDVG